METDIRDMKSRLIACMDRLPSATSYAAAVTQRQHSLPPALNETVINISTESNNVGPAVNPRSDIPPIQPQIVSQLGTVPNQEIPVVIRARPQNLPEIPDLSRNISTHDTPRNKTVLLIGDSILKGVNTRGLHRDVQKHATSGATLRTLKDDIVRYDLRVFSHVVIYIGGNDVANQMDMELFEEKYDQLISLIKCANNDCNFTVCKIAPRGDVNVSEANASISRLLITGSRRV